MAFFVRRINKLSNWPDKNKFLNREKISADAISELKTTGNELSWWKVRDESEIELLAVALYSTMKTGIGQLIFVLVPYNDMSAKIELVNSPQNGKTAIKGFENYHYDMQNLTYETLGSVAETIAMHTSSNQGTFVFRIKISKILQKLKQLFKDGMVDSNLLSDYVKNKLDVNNI